MNRNDLVHFRHIDANASALPLTYREHVVDCRELLTQTQKQVRTPVKWPSRLVPPEYGTIGMRYLRATLTIFTTSSVEVGYTTTLCGSPEHHGWHHRSGRKEKKSVHTGVMSIRRNPVRLQLILRRRHRLLRK
jgi:hypothetical protein